MAEEKKGKEKSAEKTKKPSALKRDIQSKKRRLRNRSFSSSVLTAIRGFESSIAKQEPDNVIKAKLGTVYGLMDCGVKKGVYKLNKAARTKSRLSKRLVKKG